MNNELFDIVVDAISGNNHDMFNNPVGGTANDGESRPWQKSSNAAVVSMTLWRLPILSATSCLVPWWMFVWRGHHFAVV